MAEIQLPNLDFTFHLISAHLDLAKKMQRGLLPSAPPKIEGYHFFDYYKSARQVGGDYYDYIQLADGRFAVVVGDVAGKGVAAALLMARLSSDIRFSLAMIEDPAVALTQVNDLFCERAWDDRFVTMIVAVVDPATHEVTIVNAGHMPPMLRHRDGVTLEIGEDEAGLPVGVIEGFEFESCKFQLEPGDQLTLFTDGFSEAMNANRDLYGIKRLMKTVSNEIEHTRDLGQHILEDVSKFVAGCAQSDDMCLVSFGRYS